MAALTSILTWTAEIKKIPFVELYPRRVSYRLVTVLLFFVKREASALIIVKYVVNCIFFWFNIEIHLQQVFYFSVLITLINSDLLSGSDDFLAFDRVTTKLYVECRFHLKFPFHSTIIKKLYYCYHYNITILLKNQ